LTQANRISDAIALYEKEISRNPDDPGLYQNMALFVEQNRLDIQLAETYRAAFNRFKDDSWASKLARLYLRRKQYSDYEALVRQITGTFEGSELAKFISGIEPNPRLNPELYRQINFYAHQRFPHNLTFIRNLLTAYRATATADAGAYVKLLRENWFYNSNLRRSFFEYLSRTGELRKELAALPALEAAAQQGNVAAIQMKAEGCAWLTDFESSSGAFVKLAELAPGDRTWNGRAIAVERSLGSSTPGDFEKAVELAEQDVKAAPGDSTTLTRVGEIYADHELYGKAAPWWNRVAALNPGSANGYLEGATVFWDYYQYNSALQLIDAARTSFHQSTQFAYEAGAICENQNHFARAIDEYVKAALEQPPTGQNGLAENRLITLARRKNTAALVEQRTSAIVASTFNGPAQQLRIAILDNQGRRDEIHALLGNELSRAGSLADLDEIKQSADRFGLDDTASEALARIIALTMDPVEKIKARIDLALYKESHHDAAAAERDFAGLLNDNPELLGVIRADVDFLWRQKAYGKAVAVLTSAAARAQPPFQAELRREAAQKAADSGEFDTARRLLDQLLAFDPYNGDLLAQKAATYARAHDNAGLAHFYSDELKALSNSNLPAQEKADRIAALRRGYIPALVATQQFGEVLAQYVQLLNQFPEDESLVAEAAHFSNGHQLGGRLVSYYDKATADSPHNYRWPLLLARISSALGQYSAALAAYDKAVYVRPDRSDILLAKADLETRLLRFRDALKTNQKLYDLNYHDTRYLAEQASLYARLQNTPEAVRLLRAAYVDTNPKEASGYISMISHLIAWHMFAEVDPVYKELWPLIQNGNQSAAEAVALEAQALTSVHHPEAAIQVVRDAWAQVKSLRGGENANRLSEVIGSAAKEYLTPAEKAVFGAKLELTMQPSTPIDSYQLAQAAGLLDVAADVLMKRLADAAGNGWNVLQQLQNSRLEYGPLGRELETLARSTRQEAQHDALLQAAIEAYGNAGDDAAQLRILASVQNKNRVIHPIRYAELFVRTRANFSARLNALAKQNPAYADAVIQYLFSNGSEHDVLEALQTRGANLPAPWTKSYSAFAGLYFLSSEPWVGTCFDFILGPRTVGAELAQLGAEDSSILRHDVWFYYAARYGDYLGYRERDAADLLPAYLEAAPAASKNYVDLGNTYLNTKQLARALSLYRDALQLSPERADIYDGMAVAQARTGQTEDAIDNWRRSLRILAARVEEGPLPPDYWQTVRDVLIHANTFRVIETLRPDADAMLRAYAKRNAGYNFGPFVEGILKNAPDQARALDWVLQLARETNVLSVIEEVVNSQWIPEARKDSVYRFLIERADAQLSASAGDAASAAAEQLQRAQINYVNYLLAQNRPQEAWQILQEIQPRESRPPALQLKAAALTGRLNDELASYRSQPETAPTGDQILVVASELGTAHPDLASALKEFGYQRELDAGSAPASAYFGLAQVRIAQKRADDAKSLIRTVTVSVGAPFENLPEAVSLLEEAGMISEASGYASEWRTAVPWNPEAQLRSARLKDDAAGLDAIRESAAAPYAVRAEAAIAMRPLKRSANDTEELALLTHNAITPQEASQPFFVFARLYAAQMASKNDDRIALLRQAIALDPAIRDERLDLAAAAFAEQQNPIGLAALESYSSAPGGSNTRLGLLRQVQEQAAVALVSEKEFSRAIPFYNQVLAALPSGGEHMRILKLRDAAQTASSLAALNASRQPVITEALTQPAMVKPRLTTLPAEGIEQ
jgi:tetratricopeptide (TPR) repeat protein